MTFKHSAPWESITEYELLLDKDTDIRYILNEL